MGGFIILNGFHKSPELWRANGRVKTVALWRGGQRLGRFSLHDSMAAQVVSFSRGYPRATLRLVIEEIYPGELYDDACVSEIDTRIVH